MANPGVWKKGQSGNPKGSSKKSAERKLLKQFFADELQKELTPKEMQDLDLKVKGLRRGQALARAVVSAAIDGDQMAVSNLIRTEPKTIEVVDPDSIVSPTFLPTQKEQDELEAAAQREKVLH